MKFHVISPQVTPHPDPIRSHPPASSTSFWVPRMSQACSLLTSALPFPCLNARPSHPQPVRIAPASTPQRNLLQPPFLGTPLLISPFNPSLSCLLRSTDQKL